MTERPIIFQSEMVKALLDGRKRMTRRTKGLEYINSNPIVESVIPSSDKFIINLRIVHILKIIFQVLVEHC